MPNLSTRTRNVVAQALKTDIESGSQRSGPIVEIFGGTIPTDQDINQNNQALATIELPYPTFNNPQLGVLQFQAITPSIVARTGTATWFRLYNRDSLPIMDGTISAVGSNESTDMKVDNTSLVQNGIFTIISIVLIVPR